MNGQGQAHLERWIGKALVVCALAAAAGGATAAPAAGGGASAGLAPRQASSRHHAHALRARVALLTRALDLDARQQREVRKVLESQRAQVLAVWGDTSVPPARRVHATQVISEETTGRIRALLDDEQKKRFGPPRQPRPPAGPSPSVERWMSRGGPR